MSKGFPGGSVVKNPLASATQSVQSVIRKDPLEKEMATTPAFLPGKSHGQRSLAGCSPRGRKELDMTEGLSIAHCQVLSTCRLKSVMNQSCHLF